MQGIIGKNTLKSLVKESNYNKIPTKISIDKLYDKLYRKYKIKKSMSTLKYNVKIKLFELYQIVISVSMIDMLFL
jgi:hypothetical protein